MNADGTDDRDTNGTARNDDERRDPDRCEVFDEELSADVRVERRLLWKELGALGVALALIVLHRVA